RRPQCPEWTETRPRPARPRRDVPERAARPVPGTRCTARDAGSAATARPRRAATTATTGWTAARRPHWTHRGPVRGVAAPTTPAHRDPTGSSELTRDHLGQLGAVVLQQPVAT